jgi:hypothetical protein
MQGAASKPSPVSPVPSEYWQSLQIAPGPSSDMGEAAAHRRRCAGAPGPSSDMGGLQNSKESFIAKNEFKGKL